MYNLFIYNKNKKFSRNHFFNIIKQFILEKQKIKEIGVKIVKKKFLVIYWTNLKIKVRNSEILKMKRVINL